MKATSEAEASVTVPSALMACNNWCNMLIPS